jgi:phosphoribosyl-AMP cyclohydrolase / phosphoribosyl-ATP pyrophosphohydrolase
MRKGIKSEVVFDKNTNLVPAIIQDAKSGRVLMQAFMNPESLDATIEKNTIVFYSRSKERLWMKGEESGNILELVDWSMDCDNDSLLFKVKPHGPTCHTGSDTCWEEGYNGLSFLNKLEEIIESRKLNPDESSYTSQLFKKGINKIAQKVGEEAVEVVIEAKDNNDHLFLNESADLLFHYLILLQAKGFKLEDITKVLESRHK